MRADAGNPHARLDGRRLKTGHMERTEAPAPHCPACHAAAHEPRLAAVIASTLVDGWAREVWQDW